MGQYGRIGKRRSGSATWQWMVLGFFPGILCGGIIVFAMFASGALNSFATSTLPAPTNVVIEVPKVQTQIVVVTVTPDPNAAPTTVAAAPTQSTSSAPVGTADTSQLELPTSTPLNIVSTPVALVPSSTANALSPEATVNAANNVAPTVAGAQVSPTSGVPSALQSVASNLITIPGGTFTMGTTPQEVLQAVDECVNRDKGNCEESFGSDSSPQFQVQLESYQMEDDEVTFRQYVTFLNYLRSQGKTHKDACPSPNGASNLCIQTTNEVPDGAIITFDGTNYNINAASQPFPVYGVTWAGAQAYCEALGRRLPTEAEWEYAAKGSDPGRIYPWGNLWNPANAKTRIPRDLPQGMVAIGSYPGGNTPTGLKDMAGNVEEWVADWYGETYYSEEANQTQPVVNPQGPISGTQKVLRGGSWDTLPFFVRTVHRRAEVPAPDGNGTAFPRTIGFRCAADISATAPVSNGAPNPLTLGSQVPTATVPSTGAEGAPQTGTRG